MFAYLTRVWRNCRKTTDLILLNLTFQTKTRPRRNKQKILVLNSIIDNVKTNKKIVL